MRIPWVPPKRVDTIPGSRYRIAIPFSISSAPQPSHVRQRPYRHPRRPPKQPQEHRSGNPTRQTRGDHRIVGLRQIVPGVRHPLRRGATTLCREPVRLRPAVSRTDGQARCGPNRRSVPGGLHRPEVYVPEPTFDRRHGDRNIRLPAPALRPRGSAPLPPVRRVGGAPATVPDCRPSDGARGRMPYPSDGAPDPRAKGRVQARTRRHPEGRLRPRPHRRYGLRSLGGSSGAGPVQAARHRHCCRPPCGSSWH